MDDIDAGDAMIALPNYELASKWALKYKSMGMKHVHWTVTEADKASGRGKGPKIASWNTMEFGDPPPSERDYQLGLKTGAEILTGDGAPTGRYLVCVDVDEPALVKDAKKLLPKTGMMGGKAASPFVHYFYSVEGLMNSFKWTGKRADGTDGCLLEVMSVTINAGTVLQVVVPPSRHYKSGTDVIWVGPDGQPLGLDDTFKPAEVHAKDLMNACLALLKCSPGGFELVGRDRGVLRTPSDETILATAASAQEDAQGKPVQNSILDKREAAMIIEHAVNELEKVEPGNVQTAMNALVFNAASLLAGGTTGMELADWLKTLKQRSLEAFDAVELRIPGQNFKIWEYTVDRAMRQGEACPRRRSTLAAFRLTDQGTADLVAEEWRDQFRYVTEEKRWLAWNGVRWCSENEGQVTREVKHVLRWAVASAMLTQDKQWRECAVKYYYKSESRSKASNILSLLSADAGRGGLSVSVNDLDADPWKFCCANGTFDIKEGVLKPHSRFDLCTKMSAYKYIADTKMPVRMLKALRLAFSLQPDPESCIRYIIRWFGYLATGDSSQQKLLIVYGGGQNGKSFMLDRVLRAVLGEYAATINKNVLIKTGTPSSSTASPELADLKGVRYGLFSETDPGEYLNEARIKMLTGSSTVQARQLYGDFFTFKSECKIVMDTNHLPRLTGDDFAIMRRVRPLPYNYQIPEKDKDDRWADVTLDVEGDEILTLILNEAHAYYKEGLGIEPDCVKTETGKYAADNDTVQSFLDDACDLDFEAKFHGHSDKKFEVGCKDLYDLYKQWAKDNGYQQFNVRNISTKLQAKGWLQIRKNAGLVWKGIRIKSMPLELGGKDK